MYAVYLGYCCDRSVRYPAAYRGILMHHPFPDSKRSAAHWGASRSSAGILLIGSLAIRQCATTISRCGPVWTNLSLLSGLDMGGLAKDPTSSYGCVSRLCGRVSFFSDVDLLLTAYALLESHLVAYTFLPLL